jgi:hypothetical protein
MPRERKQAREHRLLNKAAIGEAVVEIGVLAARGDTEGAHGREDELHRHVLEAIAAGAPNAAELAKYALTTTNIKFQRICA